MIDLVYLKVQQITNRAEKEKNIIKVFKMCGLSIIVTTNITSVDFLDVMFNLKTDSINHLENQIMNLNTLTSALITPHKTCLT